LIDTIQNQNLNLSAKKYKTIVIDPPWDVKSNLTKKFGLNDNGLPYKTLTDFQISNFPIDTFADSNCDLFLWTTHTKLPFAMQLLQNWGFKFHALITWDKLSGVCIEGFYRNTELVLYGYKGKKQIETGEGNYIPTLLKAKTTGHSKKPDLFYAILRVRTKEPRIDIFARKRHIGFDAYGDQVEKQTETQL
jgi:N6-adenosine-specific RNA methylase IME4